MDVLITYVNGADKAWLESYRQATNKEINEKRFRDWGTLKYLLRAIETNMPFVDNVFLVVSSETQVPEWAGGDLKIVYHKDYIPEEFLPTFSSAALEMFLPKIEGLGEEFVYFNDDIFPMSPLKPDDFFRDGKAAQNFRHCLSSGVQYRKHARNSDRLARKAAGKAACLTFLRPQHTATTWLRSVCLEAFAKEEATIKANITPLRADNNHNQYFFLDYQKFIGRTVPCHLKKKHFSLAVASPAQIKAFFEAPTADIVCVNDTKVSPERFQEVQTILVQSLEKRFPKKSRFER